MTRIFVGGLGDNMAKDDLEREFGKYGRLNQVWVAQNPPGFAFLEFDDDRDADEAIRNMNGVVLNGSRTPGRAAATAEDPRGRPPAAEEATGRAHPAAAEVTVAEVPGAAQGGGGYDSWGHDDRYGGAGDDGCQDYGTGSSPRYRSRSPLGAQSGYN
ncbi:hypothetical protein MRX96_033782 [Rhipicephalus microplus]